MFNINIKQYQREPTTENNVELSFFKTIAKLGDSEHGMFTDVTNFKFCMPNVN